MSVRASGRGLAPASGRRLKPRPGWPGVALVAVLAAVLTVVLTVVPAAGAPSAAGARDSGVLSTRLATKLDPRLAPAVSSGLDPVSVWLSFADKGERGAADLAARLVAAEAALTPRARARRLRAHVTPLVVYDDLPVSGDYLEDLKRRGLHVAAVSRWLNRAAVRVPPARLEELAELPFVTRIAPVERMRRSAEVPGAVELPPATRPTPSRAQSEPRNAVVDYGQTFAMLAQLNVPAVHDSGYIGTGVLVCILDDGFNFHEKHEALRDIVFAPGMKRDFVQGDTIVTDTLSGAGYGHGTNVMGCVAGNLPGTYVGSGFGAQFALGRTEDDFREVPVEMLFWGMGAEWADSLGADLITSSLGYYRFDPPATSYTYADMDGRTTDVSRAAEIAASKGILVVNAVGNQGNNPSYPYLIAPSDVRTDSLIAVGAVDESGAVASFSSYGPNSAGCTKPDVAARGVNVPMVSASGNPNAYIIQGGTSFSTPQVAGLAACLLQARASWPPTMVARALRETASQAASPDNRIGWGIPDGLAALRWTSPVTGVPSAPSRFSLRLVGPNPLHRGEAMRVEFGLGHAHPGAAPARVRVFDTQGRMVRELFDGTIDCDAPAAVSWDGARGDGARGRAGLYLVALESGGERATARVVLLP